MRIGADINRVLLGTTKCNDPDIGIDGLINVQDIFWVEVKLVKHEDLIKVSGRLFLIFFQFQLHKLGTHRQVVRSKLENGWSNKKWLSGSDGKFGGSAPDISWKLIGE